ncbi:MAG: Ig-like domain-containing protein [Verrucomicrobia bacterium]|nr:Ig-like domain-containing protein [Verrucomicrobiota bacterium]
MIRRLFAFGIVVLACGASLRAADLRITRIVPEGGDSFLLTHTAQASSYYLLLRGERLEVVDTVRALALGTTGEGTLRDSSGNGSGFFRVMEVSQDTPLDSDNDGIDDVYELRRPTELNPLDSADATQLDPQGGGRTYLEVYRQEVSVPTQIAESFPADGEEGVAVTRETVVRFTRALAEGTLISSSVVNASFAGRQILSRAELSPDRSQVSLFFLENLPAGARIRVTVEGDALFDPAGRRVDADGDGVAGGVGTIDFDTLGVTPVGLTAVVGRVLASEQVADGQGGFVDRPLAGVIITVDGAEESLRTTTAADGTFKLQPAPAGRFFVHVDGRPAVGSSWPNGAYYPYVGKAWEAVAGRTDNRATPNGDIYLPLIPAGTLQPVQANAETKIEFPAEVLAKDPSLAGVEIRVPANALYDDNGLRGGRVGISPVSPDRLPEPLPEGLNLPLVITIQTDGPRNFSQPVPVRFPNTPNRLTGQPLAPGEKSALWSFDHDKGRWEIVGPMTVSADGKFVETDAGVGVRQPGWHGQDPATEGKGPNSPWWQLCGATDSMGGNFDYKGCMGNTAVGAAAGLGGSLTLDAIGRLVGAGGGVGKYASKLVKKANSTWFGSPAKVAERAFKQADFCNACAESFNDPNANIYGWALRGGFDGSSEPPVMLRGLVERQARSGAVYVKPPFDFGAYLRRVIPVVHDTMLSLTNELEQHFILQDQIDAILNGATNDAQLSPAQLAAFNAKLAELDALLEGKTAQEFYGPRLKTLAEVVTKVPEEVKIGHSGRGYYLLEDLERGLKRRGNTGPGGSMDGVILAARRLYQLSRYFPDGSYGQVIFTSSATGLPTAIPPGVVLADFNEDADGDGVTDLGESVVGTNAQKADTDGDGVSDGAELAAGTNPLDNLPAEIGLLGAVALNGGAAGAAVARDVCVESGRAYVAMGDAGVAVVEVTRSSDMRVIAQVNTPGVAQRVACAGDRLAVADGSAGLAIVDLSDPPAARIIAQLGVGTALSVTMADGVVYVGTAQGEIVTVHLLTGTELARTPVGAAVHDLAWHGTTLLALTPGDLVAFGNQESDLVWRGSLSVPGLAEGITQSRRLAVGGDVAYLTSYPGFATVNVADPTALTLIANAVDRGPNSFKQILPTGSGIGVAAVGTNPRDDGTHDVELYDLTDPTNTTAFLTRLQTPGITYAVALDRGLAYVADGMSGLEVLNYLAADVGDQPPQVSLAASFSLSPAEAESGTFAALRAEASDDVQVREVHFFVDGVPVAIDGNYPYEYRFRIPTLSATKTNFTAAVRAFDTGGRVTDSGLVVVKILPDRTSPRGRAAQPLASGFGSNVEEVTAFFNEPMQPSSLNTSSFVLRSAGADRILGTADDPAIPYSVEYLVDSRTAAAIPVNPLPAGRYQARLLRSMTDLEGNPLEEEVVWEFEAVVGLDSDGDGLLDEYEIAFGLDPTRSDQNNNSIADAAEDFDNDGLVNGVEMLLGTNPRNARTFDNISDAQLDRDGDFLVDAQELRRGTDRTRPDTDGDGWNDEVEVTTGANPLVANAFLPGGIFGRNSALALRLTGEQFASGQTDVMRLGEGQVIQVTATANVLRQGGPNELGHSVNAAPPVRVRQFDLEATDLTPFELPRLGAFVVEAEDYNFNSGESLPVANQMPYLGGAYTNRPAILGVDYFNADGADDGVYRPEIGPNNVLLAEQREGLGALQRPGWQVTTNYRLAAPADGDWQQYTRTLPAGAYWVWAAMSADGFGINALSAALDRVTGDPTQPNPALADLGSFNGDGTGSRANNRLVLLRDSLGDPAVVTLNGEPTTFRFDLFRGDVDWLVFVPVTSAPQ